MTQPGQGRARGGSGGWEEGRRRDWEWEERWGGGGGIISMQSK